jgi:hypothetical protein
MLLTEQEQIIYLANIVFLAHADLALSPKETAAIEEIRVALGAKKATLNAALKAAQSGQFTPVKTGDFAAQVSNLADMLYLCFIDGDVAEKERSVVTDFCRKVGLTQDQLNVMIKNAIARADQTKLSVVCPSCKAEMSGDSKFCPKCGKAISQVEAESTTVAFQIPSTGYAIEFSESTAASFSAALEYARSAPSFTSCTRNKKIWYLASWPEDGFEKVAKLAQLLSGIRNRKSYHAGKEVSWDELFGFTWCAGERNTAYRPIEYCFGKGENRVNPWGCKQAQMDWAEWSRWFSYGQFRRVGLLKGAYIWVFDKERIRHEVMTNLHRFRYCPYLRNGLIEAVLHALPDEVDISPKSAWKYSQSYEEVPGCIKIVEIERTGGIEYKNEYYADGVRPRGLGPLEDVLRKAFAEAGITDVTVAQIAK